MNFKCTITLEFDRDFKDTDTAAKELDRWVREEFPIDPAVKLRISTTQILTARKMVESAMNSRGRSFEDIGFLKSLLSRMDAEDVE